MATKIFKYPSSSLSDKMEDGSEPKYRTILKSYEYKRYNSDERLTSKSTIILPLPGNFSDVNSIQTNSGSGVLSNIASNVIQSNKDATVGSVVNSFKNQVSNALNIDSSSMPNIGLNMQENINNISNIQLGEAFKNVLAFIPGLSPAAGKIFNPHTTVFFEGIDLKTYQLEWKLSPFSQNDIQELKAIERNIKRSMHPKRDGIFLEYPYLWTARFKNVELNPIKRSFMTNFTMNFGSGGQINMYKDNDGGYPIVVDVSMTLNEIEIRTSEFYEGKESNRDYNESDLIRSNDPLFGFEPTEDS